MGTEEIHDKINNKLYDVEEVFHMKLGTDMNYRHSYIWQLVVCHAALQISWFIGLYTLIFYDTKLATIIWAFFIAVSSTQGISLGAHRYYSHKSFKATKSLKILLFFFQTMAGQNSMFTWVWNHKLHHTYSDTDADPHNSKRGFFFSHMGWLMAKKHPLLIQKRKQMDISELLADKMLMFQYKYFLPLYFIIYIFQNLFIKTFTKIYLFERLQATNSNISWFLTLADGWHNFHHAYPWDYRMSEFGNFTGTPAYLLDFFAYIGLAYDLKTASPNIIREHMKKDGDETGQKMLANNENLKTSRRSEDLLNLFINLD
ncbi:(11Z)-hexadec-11-enoyl-CoA conjugase-like [Polyergus mexicanus]|uniref:(11Z)-hexadec-11-enoyl-CoA conjugase-like n=1 Tax=Polyergus mexicanus TaxID=615972 RepID=UPI0038B592E2